MYSVPKITGLKFNEVNLKRSRVLSGMSWHFSHFLFKRYFPSFQLITKTITYVLLWNKKLFDPSKIYKIDSNIQAIVRIVNTYILLNVSKVKNRNMIYTLHISNLRSDEVWNKDLHAKRCFLFVTHRIC